MRRFPLLTLALLAWPALAAAQSPQTEARDLAPPVYYSPPAVYAAPQEPQLRYAPAPAEVHYPPARAVVEVPVETPRYEARQVRAPRGPLCLHLRLPMPGLRLVREPVADTSVRLATAVYQPVEPRALVAPPKAPSPRAAPQAPAKDPGGIDAAQGEPGWAVRLAKRLDGIESRLDEIQGTEGDRAPAPPPAPTK